MWIFYRSNSSMETLKFCETWLEKFVVVHQKEENRNMHIFQEEALVLEPWIVPFQVIFPTGIVHINRWKFLRRPSIFLACLVKIISSFLGVYLGTSLDIAWLNLNVKVPVICTSFNKTRKHITQCLVDSIYEVVS